MSTVEKTGGGFYRPSWSYGSRETMNGQDQAIEMLESIRNVCEQIRDEIKGIRSCSTVAEGFRDLKRIRQNTSKKKRKKAKP